MMSIRITYPWIISDDGSCTWASSNKEIQDACRKNRLCLRNEPYKFTYREFESILQVGPTCGLTAVSMMLKGEVSPSELLQVAIELGYSKNGEMFSCKYMQKLIQKAIVLSQFDNLKVSTQKGNFLSDYVIEKLLSGAVMLVPYDSDFNHAPCVKAGHKAHWALVCGIIISDKPETPKCSIFDNTYLICRHGKSRHLAIWPIHEVAKSNDNLWELSPERSELTYVVPEGGIGGENGLRGQFVIVEGL